MISPPELGLIGLLLSVSTMEKILAAPVPVHLHDDHDDDYHEDDDDDHDDEDDDDDSTGLCQ